VWCHVRVVPSGLVFVRVFPLSSTPNPPPHRQIIFRSRLEPTSCRNPFFLVRFPHIVLFSPSVLLSAVPWAFPPPEIGFVGLVVHRPRVLSLVAVFRHTVPSFYLPPPARSSVSPLFDRSPAAKPFVPPLERTCLVRDPSANRSFQPQKGAPGEPFLFYGKG